MPAQNKRKPSKNSTPQIKVEVKSEPQDLQSLSKYADDRVELLQEIFTSLKGKTIKAIAPAFLQDKSLETIQKHCLEELLGISKKRLISIINATKCPTDTESSDSDVENIEEHISLEEISSDSESGLKASKQKKKDSKPNTSGKKELSVLELLELQARARAIRSQLALEPVTKIEIDSDDNSENENNSINKESKQNGTTQPDASSKPTLKPLRLKRNFRRRQMEPESPEKETKQDVESENQPKIDETTIVLKTESNPIESTVSEVKRSPSPDVITIVPSPEMLCISSDDDEDRPTSSSISKYIGSIMVPEVTREETEDELFLRKIKESNTGLTLKRDDNLPISANEISENNKTEKSNVEDHEPEEGEIDETDDEVTVVENENDMSKTTIDTCENNLKTAENESSQDCQVVVESNANIKSRKESTVEDIKENLSEDKFPIQATNETIQNYPEKSDSSNDDSDSDIETVEIDNDNDEDDDVIDLGKYDELDFDNVEEDRVIKTSSPTNSNSNDKSIEKDQEESWGSRWIKGKKVSKILATSKLASRIRSNLKQRKVEEAAAAAAAASAALEAAIQQTEVKSTAENSTSIACNQHEEGSIQQYEQILREEKS